MYFNWGGMGYTLVKLVSVSLRMVAKPLLQSVKKTHLRNLKRLRSPWLDRVFEKLGQLSHNIELHMHSHLFQVEDADIFKQPLQKSRVN